MRTHRRKIPANAFNALPDRLLASVQRSAALLRIAVLLHRGYDAREIPRLDAAAEGRSLAIALARRWLEPRALLRADLAGEPPLMAPLGIRLAFEQI